MKNNLAKLLSLTCEEVSFEEWMKTINEILVSKIGLSTDDLPDMCYMDMYESGCNVEIMIEEIEAENSFFGLMD